MNRSAIVSILDALRNKQAVQLNTEVFPQLSETALKGYEHIDTRLIEALFSDLCEQDIPTFERALKAIDENELAWLGFKLVYDPEQAVANTDNEVTKKYGDTGSAHGKSMVFFCNDAKEIVCSQSYSARDAFQMKDATRGPAMHTSQFEGLYWVSTPLFEAKTLWLLGASDVASELASLAKHVGFQVNVCDYDASYCNEERFPDANRILFSTPNFDELDHFTCSARDYVCVLTRGHMFDPECCAWAAKHQAHYIGMMGCKGKNEKVHDLVLALGASEADWQRIKRPIGLKFGAKTPAELAISIVAELIDVRYKENYSETARKKHDEALY